MFLPAFLALSLSASSVPAHREIVGPIFLRGLGFALAYDSKAFGNVQVMTLPDRSAMKIANEPLGELEPSGMRFTFFAIPKHSSKPLMLMGHLDCLALLDGNAKASPFVRTAAQVLQTFLAKRAEQPSTEGPVPDLNEPLAAQPFHPHLSNFETPYCSGILFVTADPKEDGSLRGETLRLVFQGLSKDGKHYLSGQWHISHPGLSKLRLKGTLPKQREAYRDMVESLLNQGSFDPALQAVEATLKSLRPTD